MQKTSQILEYYYFLFNHIPIRNILYNEKATAKK